MRPQEVCKCFSFFCLWHLHVSPEKNISENKSFTGIQFSLLLLKTEQVWYACGKSPFVRSLTFDLSEQSERDCVKRVITCSKQTKAEIWECINLCSFVVVLLLISGVVGLHFQLSGIRLSY